MAVRQSVRLSSERDDGVRGWLANGAPLTQDDLGEWLCDASRFRVVLDAGELYPEIRAATGGALRIVWSTTQ